MRRRGKLERCLHVVVEFEKNGTECKYRCVCCHLQGSGQTIVLFCCNGLYPCAPVRQKLFKKKPSETSMPGLHHCYRVSRPAERRSKHRVDRQNFNASGVRL